MAPPNTPKLSPEAVLVLALAGTSMPFSDSPEAEVERWLRVLRLHGRTGCVLQAIGIGESPLRAVTPPATRRHHRRSGDHVVDLVSGAAADAALARGAAKVETADILVAVHKVYGRFFDDLLEAHGTTAGEILERLALAPGSGRGNTREKRVTGSEPA
jgi:hypothetical protein